MLLQLRKPFYHLESIEVFTTRENVFLAEVFIAMGKSKEALPNEKEAKSVEAYFKKTYPNMDFTRHIILISNFYKF